ncbi:MAG TPA: hypothetical protein VNG33_09790, partial [Polyangiaceae bacterium]|nr:hypothetical protein [Polyangiaceae bacterium]
ADLQVNVPTAYRVRMLGSLAMVSSQGGGVIAVDLSDPLAPHVVSAGNNEALLDFDYFNSRVLAVNGDTQLTTLELPGPVVTSMSVPEGGVLADATPLGVAFNEAVTKASVETGALLRRLDTGDSVPFSVAAVDDAGVAAHTFNLAFAKQPGVRYALEIQGVQGLRGALTQWVAFTGHFSAGPAALPQPRIHYVDAAAFHLDASGFATVHGEGFTPETKLLASGVPLGVEFVDAGTLRLAYASVAMLAQPLGEQALEAQNGSLSDQRLGALLVGDTLADAKFSLSPESSSVKGGATATIRAQSAVLLPGSVVILRSPSGKEIRTEHLANGSVITDLKDDVLTLQSMSFRVPGVLEPEVYSVFVKTGGRESLVGRISYTLESGRSIDLPNYPPMVIGASETQGDRLFVGVKAGADPTGTNRFLMKAGMEIYDINIWDKPIRLSQLRLSQPVTGLTVQDQLAYLASGSDGLVVVSLADLSAPQVVHSVPVPGSFATDVALHRVRNVLALGVGDPLGTGVIRFFDTRDPELDPPLGYSTISLVGDDLAGVPADLAWRGNKLYVLLARGSQLFLAIFDDPSNPAAAHHVQAIDRGTLPPVNAAQAWNYASMAVEEGQVLVTTGDQLLVLQEEQNGSYTTSYWEDDLGSGGHPAPWNELTLQQGSIFLGTDNGVRNVATPKLAVVGVEPPFGAALTSSESILIQLSDLMDTTPERIASAVHLFDAAGQPVAPADYELSAINTLAGGQVLVTLHPSISAGLIELR